MSVPTARTGRRAIQVPSPAHLPANRERPHHTSIAASIAAAPAGRRTAKSTTSAHTRRDSPTASGSGQHGVTATRRDPRARACLPNQHRACLSSSAHLHLHLMETLMALLRRFRRLTKSSRPWSVQRRRSGQVRGPSWLGLAFLCVRCGSYMHNYIFIERFWQSYHGVVVEEERERRAPRRTSLPVLGD